MHMLHDVQHLNTRVALKVGEEAESESEGPWLILVKYICVLSTINLIPDLSRALEGEWHVFIRCGFY